ncbi:hypothetical protein AK812_SmicGene14546 [Symbiodinium microadriaticum]|uniref:Uncharacterized protein n=1 Tax=Symbiodinium microadriaticum TaxID=2951 RepID=A0A1Q9E5B3_SYMMI|nr:hypothetical protein AK812_SmicGene14546 [Symbiodinium microadriaticum]CAE7386359.1 unnamed protein product [Symbiodinium microadriaticum]CAE7949530.1 unnamed protein product [Symbiodinium sp. KB8]
MDSCHLLALSCDGLELTGLVLVSRAKFYQCQLTVMANVPEAVQQRLLELESLISEVRSRSQSSRGSPSPRRASGQGLVRRRPASAGARPNRPASSNVGWSPRPQSARSAPIPTREDDDHTPAQASPRGPTTQDFQSMLELVGSKAAARFTSLQQCFRMLDADHNGRATSRETAFASGRWQFVLARHDAYDANESFIVYVGSN